LACAEGLARRYRGPLCSSRCARIQFCLKGISNNLWLAYWWPLHCWHAFDYTVPPLRIRTRAKTQTLPDWVPATPLSSPIKTRARTVVSTWPTLSHARTHAPPLLPDLYCRTTQQPNLFPIPRFPARHIPALTFARTVGTGTLSPNPSPPLLRCVMADDILWSLWARGCGPGFRFTTGACAPAFVYCHVLNTVCRTTYQNLSVPHLYEPWLYLQPYFSFVGFHVGWL